MAVHNSTLSCLRFAEDLAPLDESIDCPASRAYSKAYLHHLFKAGELLGQTLLSWHNVAYYQSLMQRLRAAISEGRLGAFRDDFKEIARTQHRGSSDPHCIP